MIKCPPSGLPSGRLARSRLKHSRADSSGDHFSVRNMDSRFRGNDRSGLNRRFINFQLNAIKKGNIWHPTLRLAGSGRSNIGVRKVDWRRSDRKIDEGLASRILESMQVTIRKACHIASAEWVCCTLRQQKRAATRNGQPYLFRRCVNMRRLHGARFDRYASNCDAV